jgi:salicylate hydroxylase
MANAQDIAIIGAGMGGLVAAIGLQSAGARVRVYEQARILGEVGAGITLSPNASRILDHLGLAEGLRRIGYTPPLQRIRHFETGATLVETPRGDLPERTYGAGYYHVHRADLHALLSQAVRAADPDAIVLDKRLTAIESPHRRPVLHFADGSRAQADVVIGADGVRSAVRDLLFETSPPHFTGHVAWRAIVAAEDLPTDIAEAPPGIHIGPGKLFMRYPVRHGAFVNYAAFAQEDGWRDESWSARASVSDAVSAFAGWDRLALEVIKATPADGCFKWALFARDPLESWTMGRVTLLGDAAHAMLPFMGQGAAMAIEDGLVLARCLIDFPDPDEALARYQDARIERATFVQSASRAMGERLESANPGAYTPSKHVNEESMGLFAYDAVTTPI